MRLLLILFLAGSSPIGAMTHRVAAGDNLWNLARRYYQSSFKWPWIAKANEGIKDPHWIYPGQILEIPPAEAPVAAEEPAARPVVPVEEQDLGPPRPTQFQMSAGTARLRSPPPRAREEDDVSADLAPAMTGYYPGWPVLRVPDSWRADGRIVDAEKASVLAQAGDKVYARWDVSLPAKPGERFAAYRPAAPKQNEGRLEGHPLQQTALLEAFGPASDGMQGLRVLQAAGGVEAGDLIKKEQAR